MVARTDAAEPSRAAIEAAALWQAQLADEDCDEEDRRAFRHWLQADPSHETAFDRMSAFAGKLADRDPVERDALGLVLTRAPLRRVPAILLLAGTAAALSWLGAGNPAIRSRIADRQTTVGEQQRMAMAQGDRLVFDSDSAADLDDDDRMVTLWRGGVQASVAKAREQAFIVRTPQGTARALGTQFSVRVHDGVTTVSVVKSRVEACARASGGACLVLMPGQAARMDGSGIRRLADIDPAAEQAWADGLLVVDDLPLVQVLARLNQYRTDPVHYSAADLQGLHVTGTFPLTDPDRALVSLQAALPIIVDRGGQGGDGAVSIRRR
ncbi:DUF4880 domain-containing protein [Altererythrobacter xixiisoli]|uniref:DUF4880 domain-containing protein n=1 Tax=Croceibacterium xixiisoli TaxID=1476466 RepID=A0A6I4U1K0_9SPHN|nr:FecR domain-containing protein [Croceibacterium xixiisoli]MXP00739.1 DUF4880 domain-containing protein [Croceibacterium xixiisoli]